MNLRTIIKVSPVTRWRLFLKQLKGGDPMSSEKPGEAIGSVRAGGDVEQPLHTI